MGGRGGAGSGGRPPPPLKILEIYKFWGECSKVPLFNSIIIKSRYIAFSSAFRECSASVPRVFHAARSSSNVERIKGILKQNLVFVQECSRSVPGVFQECSTSVPCQFHGFVMVRNKSTMGILCTVLYHSHFCSRPVHTSIWFCSCPPKSDLPECRVWR